VPVFKTTQELKDFILWAAEAKIKAFKVGNMEVQFSDIAFIDAIQEITPDSRQNEERNTSKTITDTLEISKEEEDDLLFWSSKT